MAAHSVPAGAIGSSAFTLEPGVISTVTFAEDLLTVEVVSDGTAEVWWTCNGDTPALGVGYYLPGFGVDERRPPSSTPTVVKVLSSGATKVRVQRGG